jgi:hypothetical protein
MATETFRKPDLQMQILLFFVVASFGFLGWPYFLDMATRTQRPTLRWFAALYAMPPALMTFWLIFTVFFEGAFAEQLATVVGVIGLISLPLLWIISIIHSIRINNRFLSQGASQERTSPGKGSPPISASQKSAPVTQTELDRLDVVIRTIKSWQQRGLLTATVADAVLKVANQEMAALTRPAAFTPGPTAAPIIETPPPVAEPVPQVTKPGERRPAPVRPAPKPSVAAPAGPAFAWSDIGTYLLSERTLIALLTLGAFMVLVSGFVISIFNPTELSPWPHLGTVAATAVIFFAAGYTLRTRLDLVRTGEVLLAIGGGFIPLAVWSLGAPELLNWATATVWLLASLLGLGLYSAFYSLLRDRAFAVLSSVAAGSVFLSAIHQVQIPIEWGLCALVVLAVAYIYAARRLRPEFRTMTNSLNWTAQIATPVIMLGLMILAFFPDAWDAIYGREEALSPYAVGTAWWLGALFYLVAYQIHSARAFLYATLWIAPVAYLFTMTEAPWSADWYNVGLAALAGVYLFGNRNFRYRIPIRDLSAAIVKPELQVALSLTIFAMIWPFTSLDSAIPTFFSVAGLYAVASYQLNLRPLHYLAAYLLPVPFVLTFQRLYIDEVAGFGAAWFPFWLAALASAYFLLGYLVFTRRSTEGTRFEWRTLGRQPVYQVTGILILGAIIWPEFTDTTGTLLYLFLTVLFASVTLLLGKRILAYAAMLSLIVAGTQGIQWMNPTSDMRVLLWATAAIFMFAIAETLTYRSGESRHSVLELFPGGEPWKSIFAQPLFLTGYAMSLIALLVSVPVIIESEHLAGGLPRLPHVLEIALLLIVLLWSLSASTRRTSLFVYPATVLVLGPIISLAIRGSEVIGLTWTEQALGVVVAILGVGYLALALLLDRAGGHYAKPVFMVGYPLVMLSVFFAGPDREFVSGLLGLNVVVFTVSAMLVHRGNHPSFQWVMDVLIPDRQSLIHKSLQSSFIYASLLIFPVWVLVTMGLVDTLDGIGQYGVALAAIAPIYVVLGIWFRTIREHYLIPWALIGFTLSAIGPLVALDHVTLQIPALGISILLYATAAYVTRQPVWAILVALLFPLWIWQGIERFGDPDQQFGLVLVILSVGYAVSALAIHLNSLLIEPTEERNRTANLARPFLLGAYVISTIGLMLIPVESPGQHSLGYALAAMLYGGSLLLTRKSLFAYPFVITFAFSNLFVVRLAPISDDYLALGLLPGIVAIFLLGIVLRNAKWSETLTAPPLSFGLGHVHVPFFVATYLGTIPIMILSILGAGVTVIAMWIVAVIFATSIYVHRYPPAIYATYGSALVAFIVTVDLIWPDLPAATFFATLSIPAWIAILMAAAIMSQIAMLERPRWPMFGLAPAIQSRWTRPLMTAGIATVVASLYGSTPAATAGLVTALFASVFVAVLATVTRGRIEALLSIALATLSLEQVLRLSEFELIYHSPFWAGASLSIALLSITLRARTQGRMAMWFSVLSGGSIALGLAAVIFASGVALDDYTRAAVDPMNLTISIFGVVLITYAFVHQTRFSAYTGVAMLLVAYMLRIVVLEVTEPQAFAFPAGIYLLAIAFNEWRRGTREDVRHLLEIAGVVLLLGTTALQSLGIPATDVDRYEYALLLLLQSLAVFGLSAIVHWRNAFFAGIAGTVISVGVFLEQPVRSMNTWYLVLAIGIVMLIIVGFIERRRREIPFWIEDWRKRMESWT